MKTIKTFAFAVLALAMSFATTSCSKDDAGTASVSTTKIETPSRTPSQQSQKETQKETQQTNNTMAFSYIFSEDMLNLFDLTLTYTDANGEQKTETIKAEDGTKESVSEYIKETGETITANIYNFHKSVTFTNASISNATYKIDATLKATPLAQKDRYDLIFGLGKNLTSKSTAMDGLIHAWGLKNLDTYSVAVSKFFAIHSGSFQLDSASTRGRLFY